MNRQTKNTDTENSQTSLSDFQKDEKCAVEAENPANQTWQKDIEKHDYYYDDSHGYKIFDPHEDEEETDEN